MSNPKLTDNNDTVRRLTSLAFLPKSILLNIWGQELASLAFDRLRLKLSEVEALDVESPTSTRWFCLQQVGQASWGKEASKAPR